MNYKNYGVSKEIIYLYDAEGSEYIILKDVNFIYKYLEKLMSSNSTIEVIDDCSNPLPLNSNTIKSLFYYNGNFIYMRIQK